MNKLMKLQISIACAALAGASPAAAEKLATVWTFKPVTQTVPTIVELDKPFFEQRPVPYRLVRLTEALNIGKDKPVTAETLLYLVMDKTNRMAFCTFKDNSSGNAAKSLFIPALDRRPCLIDDDRDGRFEKTFSVFELWGSVAPTPKGDMARASAITPVGYVDADPAETPTEYRLSYWVHATNKGTVPQLRFKFEGKNEGTELAYPSERDGEFHVANPFNHKVRMKLDSAGKADIVMKPTDQNVMVVLFDKYDMMKPEEFPKPKAGKK